MIRILIANLIVYYLISILMTMNVFFLRVPRCPKMFVAQQMVDALIFAYEIHKDSRALVLQDSF